jgi:hypothetical protein
MNFYLLLLILILLIFSFYFLNLSQNKHKKINEYFIDSINNKKCFDNCFNNALKIYEEEPQNVSTDYDVCDKFFKKSFCQLDVDENKCKCKLQKDNVKYTFNSPANCCSNNCAKLKPEECVSTNNFNKKPYYCNIAGKCIEYKGTIISSHISANNCGNDPLSNQILLPFSTKEECMKTVDQCDLHNNPFRSKAKNKEECLKDVNCGFCTNESNNGKCISGTATGPIDLMKYYYCTPEKTNNSSKYEYGNHVAYILQ